MARDPRVAIAEQPRQQSVFISYDRDDIDTSQDIFNLIQANGFVVMWDQDFDSGDDFREKIISAIKSCDAVIVIWSESSVRSGWVISEANVALENKKIVPLHTEELDKSNIPMPFGIIHTIRITDEKKIISSIIKMSKNKPPAISIVSIILYRIKSFLRFFKRKSNLYKILSVAILLPILFYAGLMCVEWAKIKDSLNDVDIIEYKMKYPVNFFSSRISEKLAGSDRWDEIKYSRDISSLETFSELYRGSLYSQFATLRAQRLQRIASGSYKISLPDTERSEMSANNPVFRDSGCSQLWKMRNEIFFRLGRCFISGNGIKEFGRDKNCPYNNCKAIRIINTWVVQTLNEFEKKNVETIKMLESSKSCMIIQSLDPCESTQ